MADDTNFCGGRLRLAAFLRVVESDMPQRPSRCKRRVLSSRSAQSELPDKDHVVEPCNALMDVLGLAAGARLPAEAPRSTSIRSTDLNSPILEDKTSNENSGTHVEKQINKQPVASKIRERVGKSPKVTHAPEAEDQSTNSRKPSRVKKRRLPVNSLAMIRTTTSDGLPEPGV
jgi:hypothetical protein